MIVMDPWEQRLFNELRETRVSTPEGVDPDSVPVEEILAHAVYPLVREVARLSKEVNKLRGHEAPSHGDGLAAGSILRSL